MTDVSERFERDTATHEMTVLHDDGLYRHLRFKRPDRGAYWFDLITWPGALTVNGDCGTFTITRLDDMFEFFRGSRINPDYWSEKVRAGETRRYSLDLFRQQIAEEAKAAESEYPGLAAAVEERIFGQWAEWNTDHEGGAFEALAEFRYEVKGREGFTEPFTFGDLCDYSFQDYDWQFLWCCHAIQYGIAQYDKQKVPADA